MEIASCCQSIRLKSIFEKKYSLAYFPSRKTAICIVLKHFEEQKADRLVCGHFIVVIEWLTGWVNTQQYLLDYRMISRALLEVKSQTVSVSSSHVTTKVFSFVNS